MKVPPGWTKGEPIHIVGTGPRYAIGRDFAWAISKILRYDEIMIEFDSKEDCQFWCAWWLAEPWTLSI